MRSVKDTQKPIRDPYVPRIAGRQAIGHIHFFSSFPSDTYAYVTTAAQKEAAQTMGNVLRM